ncbi:LysR family transcriptional regulator [Buttiauxella noackiae]|uniref:LysR family transcriptional regulator n=1 Tax=Buttiauxella noackiae TaxID=82992 RepID=UPI0023558590|nr:LysR family transcriptional regulator [Buttiauxella noackiae]MCA1921036.1 LysR family transcriptional regulator [Buttiauxella noackiae]
MPITNSYSGGFIKTSQLRILVAVARHGTLIGAAGELGLSQPGVTRSIKELESRLGVQLLVRSGAGVRFTTYGNTLLRYARTVITEINRAEHEIAAMKAQSHASLNIGVSLLSATVPVYEALRRFRLRFPQARVNVHEGMPGQIIDGLRNGDFDLCLAFVAQTDPIAEFRLIALQHWPQTLAVAKGDPLANAVNLNQLSEAQWLCSHTRESWQPFWQQLAGEQQVQEPAQVNICTSWGLYSALAQDANTVSIWPDFLLRARPGQEELVPLNIQTQLPDITFGFMLRKDQVLTPVCEYFIDCMGQELKASALEPSSKVQFPVR